MTITTKAEYIDQYTIRLSDPLPHQIKNQIFTISFNIPEQVERTKEDEQAHQKAKKEQTMSLSEEETTNFEMFQKAILSND